MVMVSVDDHVVEPPDLFEGPAGPVRGPGPEIRHGPDGTNAWLYEGEHRQRGPQRRGRPAARRVRPRAHLLRRAPARQLRHDERVKDMDANGVLGSLCFPSFPQFCGQLFARTEDKDVALAMVRAYNDWHIDEWCGTHPGRFIPVPAGHLGSRGARRRGPPHRRQGRPRGHLLGEPLQAGLAEPPLRPLGPLLAGLQRRRRRRVHAHRLVLELVITAPDAPDGRPDHPDPDEHRAGRRRPGVVAGTARSPTCKVALSEGGIGWMPTSWSGSTTTTTAITLDRSGLRGHPPERGVQRNILTCFIDDQFGVASRDFLEMDNVMWECDYPHSDSTWPTAPESLTKGLSAVSRTTTSTGYPPERHAPLPLRPLRGPRGQGALHGGGPPPAGGRARRSPSGRGYMASIAKRGTKSVDLLDFASD